jgi:outer membrane protein OmpA-like peptidoglycan-associated protein
MTHNNTCTMKSLVILMTGMIALNLQAQFSYDYVKAADAYFKKRDYASAASYYEKQLSSDKGKSGPSYNPYTLQTKGVKGGKVPVSSRAQASYNLAECYRELNFPQKAAEAYEKVIASGTEAFPLTRFHYASQLRALGKFTEAEGEFTEFLNGYTQQDAISQHAAREVENLRFIQAQMNRGDLSLYKVSKLGEAVNVGGANYAAVFGPDNTLYFTSTRADSAKVGAKNANRLMKADFDQGSFLNVTDVGVMQDPGMQQGVATISADGSRMFFTRWGMKDGKKLATIHTVGRSGKAWDNPVAVGAAVNVPGYSAQQPFLMPGGRELIFSSDKPGGLGGFDLWISDVDAQGNLSEPRNLGEAVNTKNDEQAPSFHEASGSLVFASNGRVGMGGYDLFQSKHQGKSWSEPVNLGYPVNSFRDDMYFSSRGGNKHLLSDVLISSDRSADCCLETFALSKAQQPAQLSGLVISCADSKPVAGASVTIAGRTVTTGADGAYAFLFDEFVPVDIMAMADGFEDRTINLPAPGSEVIKTSAPDICLKPVQTFPPPVGTVETMENILFNYDKYYVLDLSKTYLDNLAAKLVASPSTILEIGGHTDNKGDDEYNLKLSEARAREVVKYLITKGESSLQLQSKDYGETMPVAPNAHPDGSDNPEGRKLNRRTEFKVLQR